jgi:hypothetical protein
VFPDPQDYCIGILLPDLTLSPKPPSRDYQKLLSLEARIDKELNKSLASKRSDSPRWMKEEADRAKKYPVIKQNGAKRSSLAQSKETMGSKLDTINTQMDVPDEGVTDMKDYTDVELNSSVLRAR